jgi:hypothetical protein
LIAFDKLCALNASTTNTSVLLNLLKPDSGSLDGVLEVFRQERTHFETVITGFMRVCYPQDIAATLIKLPRTTVNATLPYFVSFEQWTKTKKEQIEKGEALQYIKLSLLNQPWSTLGVHVFRPFTQKIIDSTAMSMSLNTLSLIVSVSSQLLIEWFANPREYKEDLDKPPDSETREKYAKERLKTELDIIGSSTIPQDVQPELQAAARATAELKIANIRGETDITAKEAAHNRARETVRMKLEDLKLAPITQNASVYAKIRKIQDAISTDARVDFVPLLKVIEDSTATEALRGNFVAFIKTKKVAFTMMDLQEIKEAIAKSQNVFLPELFDILPHEKFFDMNEIAKKSLKDYAMEIIGDTLSQFFGLSLFSLIRTMWIAGFTFIKIKHRVNDEVGKGTKLQNVWSIAVNDALLELSELPLVAAFVTMLSHLFLKGYFHKDIESWNSWIFFVVNTAIVAAMFYSGRKLINPVNLTKPEEKML